MLLLLTLLSFKGNQFSMERSRVTPKSRFSTLRRAASVVGETVQDRMLIQDGERFGGLQPGHN